MASGNNNRNFVHWEHGTSGRIWYRGSRRSAQQPPHLCKLLGANGLSRSVRSTSERVIEFQSSKVPWRSLDQIIHFIVGDTKVQRGNGTGPRSHSWQMAEPKLEPSASDSLVKSSVLTSVPVRSFRIVDFVWKEGAPFRLQNLFPSQENIRACIT